jgi:type IV secretion system protein TrbI
MTESPKKEDPASLGLRAAPMPVTRLNRRTLAALIGGVVLLVLLATMWALEPKRGKNEVASTELHASQQVTHADGLQSLPQDYASIPKVPQLGPPTGELGRPVLREEQRAGIDTGTDQSFFRPNAEVDADRVARLRLQDEAEAAAKAQVFFQISRRRSEPQESSNAASTEAGALGVGPGAVSPPRPAEGSTDQNLHGRKQAFLAGDTDSRIYSASTLQVPRSPYQLMAGTVIAAALVTGINSDLPGQIIATVTQNVYDTVSGQFLLIPQGSRLLGQYDSQVAYGQRRVLLVWSRLLRPDGSSIVLERVPGVDAAGYAGIEDGVDSHWGRILAGAALSTLLGVNAELVNANTAANSGSIVIATRQSSQDTVNQVGQQITRKNLDLQPTLTARPGLPLRVVVTKDLVLEPYAVPIAVR